jgi:hypothetical protein
MKPNSVTHPMSISFDAKCGPCSGFGTILKRRKRPMEEGMLGTLYTVKCLKCEGTGRKPIPESEFDQ